MNTQTVLTVALAVLLVGGLATGLVLAEPTADVLADDDELNVIDPDNQLTDDDVDDAITLAASNETVGKALEGTESLEITVQATGNLTDVMVVFVGDADNIAATVDLQDDSITRIVESVSTAANTESVTVSAHAVDPGDTQTVQFTETDAATSAETVEVDAHELDVSNVELSETGDEVEFNTTDE